MRNLWVRMSYGWDMGISFYRRGGRLRAGYGVEHGFGCGWLPYLIQALFVHTFNVIACRHSGHDDTLWHMRDTLPDDEPIGCVDCGAKITRCLCH